MRIILKYSELETSKLKVVATEFTNLAHKPAAKIRVIATYVNAINSYNFNKNTEHSYEQRAM